MLHDDKLKTDITEMHQTAQLQSALSVSSSSKSVIPVIDITHLFKHIIDTELYLNLYTIQPRVTFKSKIYLAMASDNL